MRKLILVSLIGLFIAVVTGLCSDKEYAPAPTPNALYFVWHTNCPQGSTSLTITNNETYMWSPLSIRFATRPDKPFTNTFELVKLTRLIREQYGTNTYTTDGFGNIVTNYTHGITNTTYEYITNTLVSSVTTNTTNHVFYLEKEYIQKGDILQFSWTDSTNKWLTINAWR